MINNVNQPKKTTLAECVQRRIPERGSGGVDPSEKRRELRCSVNSCRKMAAGRTRVGPRQEKEEEEEDMTRRSENREKMANEAMCIRLPRPLVGLILQLIAS